MLEASNQPLWPGCETETLLGISTRMLTMKSDHHFSERLFDDMCATFKNALPDDNIMPENYYQTHKIFSGLGLPVEKIDACPNRCMIYWGDDSELKNCRICTHPRMEVVKRGIFSKPQETPFSKTYYFPIAPRLQRLFRSEVTAKHMRWHHEHEQKEGVMQHCSDSYAWKQFKTINPAFAEEIRNVRLGLCTDGFQPFGVSANTHSTWPVILTPYNLPPRMCMKKEYIFLSVIVRGPNNPTQRIDVFLQPLIAELQMLWAVGVETWDVSKNQNFQMRAALMWTVSDFPACAMFSGWSTKGKLACPYCMEQSKVFQLKNGRKACWFDCYRKFLPQDHPYRKKKITKDKVMKSTAPPYRSSVEILEEIDRLGIRRITDGGALQWNEMISVEAGTGWKKRALFWDLPYWKTNIIRHKIDVMDTEKNVFVVPNV